jgi:hypothetical protein
VPSGNRSCRRRGVRSGLARRARRGAVTRPG